MSERAASAELEHLRALLDRCSETLPGVTQRKMFGCAAFFAEGTIYGLIWKTGRIGLKLPQSDSYDALMAIDDAESWTIGKKTMSGWVLVPRSFHQHTERLGRWVNMAHQMACEAAGDH